MSKSMQGTTMKCVVGPEKHEHMMTLLKAIDMDVWCVTLVVSVPCEAAVHASERLFRSTPLLKWKIRQNNPVDCSRSHN